jgi:SAM dependent carboxyl methyltransferase
VLDSKPCASDAMKCRGASDRRPRLRADGIAPALPHWENVVRMVPLDHTNRPVVVADYGLSREMSSFAPLRIAISTLRSRLGPDRPILVHHIGLLANDFNALFEALENDPDRYAADESNVYPHAIGRSLDANVLPPGHVDLGWSSYSAMRISRLPAASLCPGALVQPGPSSSDRAHITG